MYLNTMPLLQWALADGYKFKIETTSFLALRGNLKVLQWARANDCPWNNCMCE